MPQNGSRLRRNDSRLRRNDSRLRRNDSHLRRNDSHLPQNGSHLRRNDSRLRRNAFWEAQNDFSVVPNDSWEVRNDFSVALNHSSMVPIDFYDESFAAPPPSTWYGELSLNRENLLSPLSPSPPLPCSPAPHLPISPSLHLPCPPTPPYPMSDLDLIHQLGERLGRPLEQVSEDQFERHAQAKFSLNQTNQDRITRDAYSLAEDGTVSGLLLQPVTSQLVFGFPFHQFSSVRHLYLSRVNLPSYAFLTELKGLTTLDLRSNSISDISFLTELKGLTTLDLRSNSISDISFLTELKGLTTLDLRSNQISDISVLSTLTGLTSLDLSNTQISDISVLSTLTGLTSLDLSNTQISDISVLSTLTGLILLDLSNNQISDISVLSTLTGLILLDLSNNQISDISFLSTLTGLTSLYLSNNRIKEVPGNLAKGRLAIGTGSYESYHINLGENPIETPPLEIVSQGNEAILNYYAQLATQGQDHLYEAKMLIVGEGEAGKTTLAHKIAEPNCPLPHVDDRTRGISIQAHHFTCRDRNLSQSSEPRDFHLNV